jgi:hypothetical protein
MKRNFALICLGPLAAMSIAVGTAQAQSGARAGASGAASVARPAVTPATPKPTITITNAGNYCGSGDGYSSDDSTAFTESYFADGEYLSNYQLGCVFDNGVSSESATGSSDCGAYAPSPTMLGRAQFEDGEESLVCGEPDVTANGSSDANSEPYYSWTYGDYCKAIVLTGAKGTTQSKLVTYDEVEWYQPYTDYDGNFVNSDTTVCVGVVPNTKGIKSSVATHKVACSETDPYTGKTIAGSAVTTTYPDRQFEEVCSIPNAKT